MKRRLALVCQALKHVTAFSGLGGNILRRHFVVQLNQWKAFNDVDTLSGQCVDFGGVVREQAYAMDPHEL